MKSTKENNGKLVAFAIQALNATIKAIELKSGITSSQGEYRYELPQPGADGSVNGNARIYRVDTGEDMQGYNKPLQEWAESGKLIRLAFIALNAERLDYLLGLGLKEDDVLDLLSRKRRAKDLGIAPESIRYTLNVLDDEAYLTVNGERMPDKPTTISQWAKRGREIEQPLFDSLKAAKEYGSEKGFADAHRKMIALGIIRNPPQAPDAQAQ